MDDRATRLVQQFGETLEEAEKHSDKRFGELLVRLSAQEP